MFYLIQVNFALLGPGGQEPAPSATAWLLYARCADKSGQQCDLVDHVTQLGSAADRKSALLALHKLIQVTATGLPLQQFYDEKQCHEIHTFFYRGKDRKVWRIRHGDIRLLFVYGMNRLIFLPLVIAKRKNKLSASDKAAVESHVKPFVDAELQQQFCFLRPTP